MEKNQTIRRKHSIIVKRISAVCIALLMLLTSFSVLTQISGPATVKADGNDTTPPDQTIQIGEPKIPIIWHSNDYYVIGPNTPITITSTDNQSGSQRIEYSVWLAVDINANPVQWQHMPQYDTTVYDYDQDGTIVTVFYLLETCFHQIRYQCWDNEGNTAGLYTKDIFVDASAPVSTKTIGCPEYGVGVMQPPWANAKTPITFTSVDQSCFPDGTGVSSLVIKVWRKAGTCNDQGPIQLIDTITINDNDANDLDQTVGSIEYEFHFQQTGYYELEWFASDVFGNTELAWKQQHRVDVEPPSIIKTHPTHGYMRINETAGYLKCGLPISLTAEDEPTTTCNVGFDRLFWRYEYQGNQYPAAGESGAINGADIAAQYCFNDPDIENHWWYLYTTDIIFTEECQHDLYYFATDNLGNYELHHQIYYVDNTAPYAEMTYPEHGYYPGDVDYLKCYTPITINAYDTPQNLCQSGIESVFYRYEWDGNYYPSIGGEGIVSGQQLVEMYGADYNIPDIIDFYWYRVDASTVDVSFAEQCQHDLYFFAKDNVCHHSQIYHLTFYVDNEIPSMEISYPDHGFYLDRVQYLKAQTPITLNAYDMPDNECAAGIESIFWRYEWNGETYPNNLGEGIVSGEDLVVMYGEDYNISEITNYYWYYVDASSVDIQFNEECMHTLYYFAKDNVCHHGYIENQVYYVDNSSPIVDLGIPQTHGYYYPGEGHAYIKPNVMFSIEATDLPENSCAAGIESIFYRYEWNGTTYPSAPGEGIIQGMDLVSLYGEDYNTPEFTDYYWYRINDSSVELTFAEECSHDLYYFAKDNVCHHSQIFHTNMHVDDSAPVIELQLPTHGYFMINETAGYLSSAKPVTLQATDYPDNACAAGIESIFYRYEWNGQSYPTDDGIGIVHGEELVAMYGADYNIPEITNYYWYYVDAATAEVYFAEQCSHQLYFFTKDNVCHRSEISTHTFYVDDQAPYITYDLPQEHGYYLDEGRNIHIKAGKPVVLTATDLPENECGAGIESIFWRYNWDGTNYPTGLDTGVIYGQDLVTMYGSDYNIPEITEYYWYRVDGSTVTIQFSEECAHQVFYFTKDNVCHRSDIADPIWYIDGTGPTVQPTYPTHGYVPITDVSGYLKVDTPFMLTATDLPTGDCAAGFEALFYRYEWQGIMYPNEAGDFVVSGQELVDTYGEAYTTSDIQPYLWYRIDYTTTEIEFSEQCQHDVYFFAKDNLCNHGAVSHKTYYVDASLPMVGLEYSAEGSVIINEDTYLQCSVPIWINATDNGECQAGVESIFYRYVWNDTMYPEGPGQGIVSGNDLVTMYGDSYATDDIMYNYWYRVDADTATILFDEDCEHTIYYFAKDNVCQHSDVYSDVFHVDCTPPTIVKEVGDPKCIVVEGEEYCITSTTPIYIDAFDTGCCVGQDLIVKYKINDGDWIQITGQTMIFINEPCTHTLTIRAWDCVGNMAEDIEIFHVDDTPPMIIKTVGEPKLVIEEGVEYCVNQETEITVETQEQGCCIYGVVSVEYRIGFNDQWTEWMPYEGPISFTEDCNHTLELRATDCLGNTAYDQELFHVDSTPPILHKKVSSPKVDLGVDEYGHDQWMVFPQTFITLTAEDAGCCPCPEPMIYYRYWFLGHWTDWMTYTEPFNFNRGCLHYLEAYTMDCLGNMGPIDNETFIVHVPDGYDDPLISFENPLQGETHCEHTLDVIINASDAQTPTQDLIVKLSIPEGRRNAPTLWYETTYNPKDGFFHASIDIFEYQNGAEITLEAYVIDGDNKYVFALPVTFTVCSHTGYDQWMQEGWNSLVIPLGEISCSNDVQDVLGSIYCHYSWVWYYNAVTDQWSSWYKYREPGFNSLTTMETGKQYWVYMENADRYYTDTIQPMVTIDQPLDGSILNILTEVSGTAYDDETGLKHVELMIYDTNTEECWDGDSWEEGTTYLLCIGTETWMYNVETVAWISGHTYEITAIATDMVGCQATDMVSFLWDTNPPMITILDPVDGEQRIEGPDDMNFEVVDQECYVTDVYVEIFDQTTSLYFDGSSWQANQIWLTALYDSDDQWYYPTEGIWPAEFGHTFQVTVKAYDCIYNMGTETSSFTIVEPQGECSPDYTYTTDADFDKGILSGAEHDTVHNQLQMIPGEVSTYPVMWIANAGEDSLSKWDTHNNIELARYHTWFGPLAQHGAWSGAAPSRTCVDSEGNGYVANRHFDGLPADVIKIYTNDWIDRNHDGHLNTSTDTNGDGTISADEMLPMVDTNGNQKIDDNEITDERVAWVATIGGGGQLGRSLAIDLEGNIWLGLFYGYCYYKLSSVDGSILGGPYNVGMMPYGGLVDRYGYLWTCYSNTLSKLNTRNPTEYQNYYVSNTYGLALGYDSLGNTLVYLGYNCPYAMFNSSTGTYSYPADCLFTTLGVATDSKGNILVGSYNDGTGSVAKFAPNGDTIWHVTGQVASEVRGVAVDSEDNVWGIYLYESKLCKYNGTNGAYMGIYDSGYMPYTYSDATGLGYATSVSVGTWDVVHDSYAADTTWNKISWNSNEPEGSKITVKVRSSNDKQSWSPWEVATNGNSLSSTSPGRYLNILTTFEQDPLGASPILYDLTVDGTCAGVVETPHVSMQKQVWVPGENTGYWGEERDATLGDIVCFKISVVNDGQCEFLGGSLTDYLPSGLQYLEGSANITIMYNGETWYSDDPEPWIFPEPDGTILLWNGSSSGIGEGYPPTMQAFFEFEAQVDDCSEPLVINTANVTVEPACGDTLYAEDTAMVNIECLGCVPTGTVDKAVWDNETKEWISSIQADIDDVVQFGIYANIPENACTLYNGYMEDYLPDGLTYVPESTNIILYYGGNMYKNISGSQCEPHITDHDSYITLRWDSQNGYADTLPATGEVYISYRTEVTDYGTFVNIANGTGFTDTQIRVNDDGNATVYVIGEEPGCIEFSACVDGTDWLTIDNYQLSIYHGDWEPMGSTGDCSEFPEYCGYIAIDGVFHTIELPDDSDQYLIDGQPSLTVGIQELNSFSKLEGRGPVSWDGEHTIFIDDSEGDSGGFYSIQLCSEEQSHPPVVTITSPEDGEVLEYNNFFTAGSAYDTDSGDFVDEVFMQYYMVDDGTTYYYNDSENSWTLESYTYTLSGSGSGTIVDPFTWEYYDMPVDESNNGPYYVHVYAYDQNANMGEDTVLFWYLEGPSTYPVHNLNTDEYFETIQAAIDDPDTDNGHTIEVSPGIYNENVYVDKELTFIGISNPVVDGSGGETGFYVDASNVAIDGFTIINVDRGIELYGPGFTIQNNIIKSTYDGIDVELQGYGSYMTDDELYVIGDSTITNNHITVFETDYDGIWFDVEHLGYDLYGSMCTIGAFYITDNTITADYGIDLDSFSYLGSEMRGNAQFSFGGLYIQDNTITSISDGIYIDEITYWGYNTYDNAMCSIGDIQFNGNTIDCQQVNYDNIYDDISGTVHIARGPTQGIYNSVTESSYSGTSPENTEWSNILDAAVADPTILSYTNWGNAVAWTPPNMVGKVIYMHIISEDRYFEMHFSNWQSGGGGGFSYTRYEIINGEAGDGVTFTRPNGRSGGDGIYVDEIEDIGYDMYGTSSFTMGNISFNDNIIDSGDDGIYVDYIEYFGEYIEGSSMFTMGNLEFNNNNIICDKYGLYLDYAPYQFGYDMSGSSSFTMGDFTINNNDITSVLESIDVEYPQYWGEDLYDFSSFTMGNVECCGNTINAIADDGIQYDDIYKIGYGTYDSSSFAMGSFLFNNNDITSGDYGLYIYYDYTGEDIDDDSTFTMGNLEACNNTIGSVSEGMYLDYYSIGAGVYQNAVYTMGDILVNDNTIASGDDGIYVDEIDGLGYDVFDNVVYSVGNIEFQRNSIIAGDDGMYFNALTDIGYNVKGDATCTYGKILVCQNMITSAAKGIEFNEISIGSEMYDTASVTMGDFKVNDNTITSPNNYAIDFNDYESLMIGYTLHDQSTFTMGDITFDNNIINNSMELSICTDGLGEAIFDSASVTMGDILVENNQVSNSTNSGIFLYVADDVIVRGNTVTNAYGYGIISMWGSNNIIEDNIVTGCMEAIQLYISNDNTLNGNTFTGSEDGRYGVDVWQSSGNLICNNYLNNPQNAFDNGANTWNITKTLGTNIVGGPYLGGNYFSDYAGIDGDSDGLGDTPYAVSGGSNQDTHPLVIVLPPAYHGKNLRTGEEFVTIQEAIDDPDTEDGDTIIFNPGLYNESVEVTKELTIQSASGNPEDTIVQSAEENESVFNVQADEVTIQGFTCTGATGWWLGTGILLNGVDDCTLKNNILTGNNVLYTLSIYYSYNNIIEGNNVSNNQGAGIIVDHSDENTLQGNIIQGNQGNGVAFFHGDYNILGGNTIQNNLDEGIMLWVAGYNTILGNTVTNNGRGIGTYFDSSHGNLIYNNYFDNTYNADDDYDNAWNITPILGTNIIGGNWLAGNYWSDYTGADTTGDGLGDTPYLIEGYVNQDNHPLYNPLENHPPGIPAIVSPADGATGVSVDTFLTWTCTDSDSADILHYTVRFDYAYPPASHAINILDTTYDPGTIAYNQIYYWQIVAFDDHGRSTEGPIWSFTTEDEPPNNPPNTPNNLEPTDGFTISGVEPNLYWTGGDPDAGDTVSYEIHFGIEAIPTAVGTVGIFDNSTTIRDYDLGTLSYNTQYFWYIIATDNHGSYSIGPTWNFTTGFNGINPSDFVGYWKFDEGTGTTAADSSGHGRVGTLYGSPYWMTGKVGQCLRFAEANSYVKLLYSDGVAVSGDWTVMAWVYAGTSSSNGQIITRSSDTSWDYGGLQLFTKNDNKAWLDMNSGSSDAISDNSVRDSTWHHLVGMRDSSGNLKIYVDGVLSSTAGYSGVTDMTTFNWFIGAGYTGGYVFQGYIDEVAILDRTLTLSEIQLCYNNGLAGHGYIS